MPDPRKHAPSKPTKPTPSQYWKQFKTQSVRVGMLLGQLFSPLLRRISPYLKKRYRQPLSFWRQLWKRSPALAALCIALAIFWIVVLLFNLILPGRFVFEGNVTAQSLNFTHVGSAEKLLFDTVPQVQTFSLSGSQPGTLVLEGEFSNSSNSALNAKLKDINQLAIEFSRPSSRIRFEPVKPEEPANMTLLELRLNSQVNVQNLAYQASSQRVSICLRTSTSSASQCNFTPDVRSKDSSEIVGTGVLQLGENPIKIGLSMVDVPQLDLQSDINNPKETQIEFRPSQKGLKFQLQSPTQVSLTSSQDKSTAITSLDWIRPDINVQNVEFIRTNNTNEAQNSLGVSSIVAGQVRMANQSLTLQPRQHLVFSENPGIRKLSSISLSQAPGGLQILFTGQSRGVAIGLSPDFPIETIRPRLLSKYISPGAFNALLVLGAALTGTLLPQILASSDSG